METLTSTRICFVENVDGRIKSVRHSFLTDG